MDLARPLTKAFLSISKSKLMKLHYVAPSWHVNPPRFVHVASPCYPSKAIHCLLQITKARSEGSQLKFSFINISIDWGRFILSDFSRLSIRN